MSRLRRLVIHSLIVAGVLSFGFVFASTSTGSSAPVLHYAAVIASGLLAAGFAVHLAMIVRERAQAPEPAPASSSGISTHGDWRAACVAAWLIVSLAAALSELLGGGSPDAPRLISTLGYALLIALFAWQAFRTVKLEQGFKRP